MHLNIMITIAFITILLFLRKLGYGKYTLIYGVLLCPFIWFATDMITEAVINDEWPYIVAFKQLSNLERGSLHWFKGTYQYRISEMTSGAICAAVSIFFPDISDYRLTMIYRYVHWYLYFLVALGIAYIWNRILAGDNNERKYRMVNAVIIGILVGSPSACLFLKVCNYDAGCVYFGIAGISLLVLAEKECNINLAYWSIFISALSCLEKWGGLPYWCICTGGTGALVYRYNKGIIRTVLTDFIAILASVGICYLSLVYIRLLECKGIVDINIGASIFPLFYMVKMFFGFSAINWEDINYYDSFAVPYLLVVVAAIIAFSFILELGRKLYLKVNRQKNFRRIVTGLVLTLFVGTIIASFVVVRSQYPFVEIPSDIYLPKASMNGTTYFYNTKTALGYWLCTVFYGFATVVTNWPTMYLLMIFFAIYCVVKNERGNGVFEVEVSYVQEREQKKDGSASEGYFLFLTGVLTLLLPILYVLAGDPAVPRYFGVSILLIPIIALYIITKSISFGNSLKAIAVAYAIVVFEMFLYSPNYSCFAPLWLYRSSEWKQSVRQGEWATSETMMWGEDLAIAGNRVMDMIGQQEDYGKYTLFYDYGVGWIKNPGFNIVNMHQGIDSLSFTEHDYYIFTKFRIYRSPEPDFFSIIEPIDTVEYNGEIAVWIYRGDTIKDYTSYFE